MEGREKEEEREVKRENTYKAVDDWVGREDRTVRRWSMFRQERSVIDP